MAFKLGKLLTGVVLLIIGGFIVAQIANSMFTPANTAMTTFNETLTTAGYSDEGNLVIRGWAFMLLGIGLAIMLSGVAFVVVSVRDALKGG